MSDVDEIVELLENITVRIETDEWVLQHGKEGRWLVCRNGRPLLEDGAIACEDDNFGYALFVFRECLHGREKQFVDEYKKEQEDEADDD